MPVIYLPISQDHLRSASIFVSAGLGLALPEAVPADVLASTVSGLMKDEGLRRIITHVTGPKIVTGKGAINIAADLAEAVSKTAHPVRR